MKIVILFIISLSSTILAQTNADFCIGKTDSLYSNILKEKREILVYVPQPDNPYVKTETYPVLYLYDGAKSFMKTVAMIDHLSSDYGSYRCPKMIVVAVVHPDRFKDLFPNMAKDNKDGMDDFGKFMEQELIPYIDKKYPTQPYRTVIGHSLGGLRVAHSVVYQSQLFNSYIALDPSLGHDMNVWSNKASEVMSKKSFYNASLFIAMAHTMPKSMSLEAIKKDTSGESRHMRTIAQFADDINSNKNQGLQFDWKYYPNETHSEVTFSGTYDGLNSVFSWYYNSEQEKIMDTKTSSKEAIEIVAKHYQLISNKMGYKVVPLESYITRLVEILVNKQMHDKAVAFAEYNFTNFPESELAYYYVNYATWGDKKLLVDLLPQKTAKDIAKLCMAEAKKAMPTYNISEMAINELAYQLLQANKLPDALEFFKLNTILYPKSGNSFDGFGECLLLMGKEKEGLAAYKKSLELNPANTNAEAVLKKYNSQ
jgi:predicted alpha/beta superfamily hydrolase